MKKIRYALEKHITTEYIVVRCDDEEKIRTPVARYNLKSDAIEIQKFCQKTQALKGNI